MAILERQEVKNSIVCPGGNIKRRKVQKHRKDYETDENIRKREDFLFEFYFSKKCDIDKDVNIHERNQDV